MADEKKIIEIKVELTEGVKEIGRLVSIIDTLNKEQKDNTKVTDEQKNKYAENTVALKEYRAQLSTLVRETRNEIKSTSEKLGYIQQLKAQVSNLTLEYERLSQAELQGSKGGEVLTLLKNKREELSKLEQAYGNYSRNVGNYSSATNQLALNLGMVMKEIPNFAISARIGIMSLTNNLPMLAEAIKAVRVEQAQLAAEGKKTQSMFSLLGKSVFGLTGIVSIASALLFAYSDEILKFVKNLFMADEATKKLTASQIGLKNATETTQEALNSGELADAIKNINYLEYTLKKSKGSVELQKKAVDEYNKSLGVTFGKVTNVDSALKLISKNKDQYIEAVKNMAIANAFFNQTADNMVKIMQTSIKTNSELLGDEAKGYIKSIEKAQERLKNGATELKTEYDIAGNKVAKFVAIPENRLRTEVLLATKAYNDAANEERVRQIGLIEQNNTVALNKAKDYYNRYAEIVKTEGFTVTEEQKEQSKKGIEAVNNDIESFLAKIRKEIFDTNKKLIQSGGIDADFQKKFISDYQKLVEEGKRSQESLNEIRMMFRQMAVEDADIELATAEARGQSTLQLQLNLLDAQRKAEIENARQTGADIQRIEEYYAAKRQELKRLELNSALSATGDMFGAVAALFEENTTEYKVFATAQALMNTYLGITNALAQTKGGIVAQIAGTIAAAATGFAAVRNIWKVKTDGSQTSAASGVSGGTGASAAKLPPDTTSKMATPLTGYVSPTGVNGGSAAITSGAATSISTGSSDVLRALANLPQPIVTVKDIEIAQKRVKVIDSISKV